MKAQAIDKLNNTPLNGNKTFTNVSFECVRPHSSSFYNQSSPTSKLIAIKNRNDSVKNLPNNNAKMKLKNMSSEHVVGRSYASSVFKKKLADRSRDNKLRNCNKAAK